MIQLYFLSIVFNGAAGFLFIFGDLNESDSAENSTKLSSVGNGFRLIIGILAAITGILKLLSPYEGIAILGDLIPALTGIAAGFMLIFAFYREHSSGDGSEGKINHFGEVFLHYKKAAGVVLLISAMLHFLFPTALLL